MKAILKKNIAFRIAARGLITAFAVMFCFGNAEAKKEIELQHTARYYASRAESYEDAGAWEAAKREIDEGLRLYPEDPDLRYLNGRYFYKAQGDLQQARYNLIKAIQENDQHFYAKRILVDVEDDSKHYSSAICYINELLEFQPYDRDLWRRKISLYRKIGQKSEADDALARLAQIYPNDSILKKDLAHINQENWNNRNKTKTPDGLAKELELMIDDDPYELDYYLELIKNYTILGQYERAIGIANRGLAYLPGNQQLIQKAAQLMAEVGDYTRAMSFLKEHRNTGALYNNLMKMAADDARWKDAYESNGRVYAVTKDRDALNYLVNTSIVRGYYPDAIEYLQEAYKTYGRTPALLMKQYGLEKRFGNQEQCLKLLEELYTKTPNDPDILEDYTDMIIALANHDMETEQWLDANASLDKVLSMMQPDTIRWPGVISKKITVLGRLNRLSDARSVYLKSAEKMPQYRDRFAYAYEELAAARLKKLIDNEEYETALAEAQDLIRTVEESEAALRTCINMAQTLNKKDLFHQYADMGYEKFPNSPYFIIKKAIALQEQGEIEEAMALLRPDNHQNDEYLNPQLLNAYSGLCDEYVTMLLNEHKAKEAMEWIDRGLKYDPENKELLYKKGLAYEMLKDYPKAYEYLTKYYNPTNAEQEEWEQHMRYIRWRSFRNHVDISYTAAFFDTNTEELSTIGHLYSVASVSYSHLFHNNTIMGQISYKGLDGFMDYNGYNTGGAGLEFLAQWDHVFNHRWSMMLNASYATRYFNKIGANLAFYLNCGRGWTAGLKAGYRFTPPTYVYKGRNDAPVADEYRRYHILMLSPSVEKAWDRVRTSVSGDLVGMKTGLYYNVNWKGKLFINEDNISAVGLMAGFGSFPELNFFDQTALTSISHTNATVGAEFIYLITKHLSVSVNGNWNTYYNPARLEDGSFRSAYRNVFSINVGLQTAF